jgi:hypothetical protein
MVTHQPLPALRLLGSPERKQSVGLAVYAVGEEGVLSQCCHRLQAKVFIVVDVQGKLVRDIAEANVVTEWP